MDSSQRPALGRTGSGRKPRLSPSQRSTREQLALELHDIVACMLRGFGLTSVDLARLSKRPRRRSLDTPVSQEVLLRYTQLGDLIAFWLSDREFLDDEGKPRVLPVEGSGSTFAALVRKFLPGMALDDALQFACRAAEVGTVPGGRVALFGTTLVKTSRNAETALAQCIYHFAHLSRTSLHNFNVDKGKHSEGRMERLIERTVSIDEFEAFQRLIRPQIHDLCEKVDGMLQPLEVRASRSRKHKAGVGMGIYLYADGGSSKARRALSR